MSRGPDGTGGVALLRFASALCASSDLAELEHRLVTGLGRVIHAPMYTLYVLDPLTGRPWRVAPASRGLFPDRLRHRTGDPSGSVLVLIRGSWSLRIGTGVTCSATCTPAAARTTTCSATPPRTGGSSAVLPDWTRSASGASQREFDERMLS